MIGMMQQLTLAVNGLADKVAANQGGPVRAKVSTGAALRKQVQKKESQASIIGAGEAIQECLLVRKTGALASGQMVAKGVQAETSLLFNEQAGCPVAAIRE